MTQIEKVPVTKEEWIAHLKANPDLWIDLALRTMYEAKERLLLLEVVYDAARRVRQFYGLPPYSESQTQDQRLKDLFRAMDAYAMGIPPMEKLSS